jgi:hypothetical protein
LRPPDVPDAYDDGAAERSHLDAYWTRYLTDFERRCHSLGARRARAALDPDSDWSRRVRAEWERADEDVRSALEGGIA